LIGSILFCAATHAAPVSTDGIDINGWNLPMDPVWGPDAPHVELSAWDFAGKLSQPPSPLLV
jgi:hypothetical protein